MKKALSDGVDSECEEVSREGEEGVIVDPLRAVDDPDVVAVAANTDSSSHTSSYRAPANQKRFYFSTFQ